MQRFGAPLIAAIDASAHLGAIGSVVPNNELVDRVSLYLKGREKKTTIFRHIVELVSAMQIECCKTHNNRI